MCSDAVIFVQTRSIERKMEEKIDRTRCHFETIRAHIECSHLRKAHRRCTTDLLLRCPTSSSGEHEGTNDRTCRTGGQFCHSSPFLTNLPFHDCTIYFNHDSWLRSALPLCAASPGCPCAYIYIHIYTYGRIYSKYVCMYTHVHPRSLRPLIIIRPKGASKK